MSIESQIDIAFEGAKLKMAERMFYAIVWLQGQHKDRVSKPATKIGNKWIGSKPFEYPKLRTGEGQRGVVISADNAQDIIDAGMVVSLGQTMPSAHMLHLEFGSYYSLGVKIKFQRLGYERTAKDLKKFVQALILGTVK